MATKKQKLFERLRSINVSQYVEKKNGLDYLSWAGAFILMHQNCSSVKFEKHFFQIGSTELPYTFDHSGWAFVKVSVSADNETVTEVFPVLNYANKAIQNPNSFQVNTAHQRCLVKCLAYLGLGIDLYLKEDLRDSAVVEKAINPEVLKELMLSAEQGVASLKDKCKELKGEKLDGFTQDHKKNLREIAIKADEKEAERNVK